MKTLGPKDNFLNIKEKEHYLYEPSKVVVQSAPYEYTSSYLAGSAQGPEAIIKASHYVELYDEELAIETYKKVGIATLPPIHFNNKVNEDAIKLIEQETERLLNDNKFIVSLGAEHTVTYGFVKAFAKKFKNMSVLQIDAHSDLRDTYGGNKYSHACVMHRIYDMGIRICQAGIRAQCLEEAELIKSADSIHTFYAHALQTNNNWIYDITNKLTDCVYITIDADGLDPSIMPAVGTAEPGGLIWRETLNLLQYVCSKKQVIGFDIVECAPISGSILSEYTLAKLAYRLIGYVFAEN